MAIRACLEGPQRGDRTVELIDRCGHERLAAMKTGIGQGIARVEIVRSIGHDIVFRNQRACVGCIKAKRMADHADPGIELGHCLRRALTFGRPISAVRWITCRWRLESDTVSSSTMPIARCQLLQIRISGAPRPPAPMTRTLAARSFCWPARRYAQHDMAGIAGEVFGRVGHGTHLLC